MTAAQNSRYFFLWGQLRKLQPGADRHALHDELGLPASHKDFSERDFDHFFDHLLALTEAKLPGDGDARRNRYAIANLLAALGEGESYAETIVWRMNKGGKLGGKGVTLGSLTGEQLRGVVVALDREAKRRFKTPADVLAEVQRLAMEAQLDAAELGERVRAALKVEAVPPLAKLGFDRLLTVLATVRRMAGDAPAVDADAENVPF